MRDVNGGNAQHMPFAMKKSRNAVLVAALMLILVAVAATIYTYLRVTRRVHDTTEWVSRTHDVLFQTEKILELSKANATAAQAFVFAPLPQYESEIASTKQQLQKEVPLLRSMIRDNSVQLPRVDSLHQYVTHRIAFSDSVALVRRTKNPQTALALVGTLLGKSYDDHIRSIIDGMQADERSLLTQREADNERAFRQFNKILFFVWVIIACVLLLLLVRLRAYTRLERTLQRQLENFNAELSMRLEEQAREISKRDAHHRELVEQASDGIFVADASGRYIDVNSRGCEITGYSKEELADLNIADLLSAESIPGAPLHINDLRAGKSLITELVIRKKDGSSVPVEISAKMLLDGRMQAIVRDITDRKKIERALEESEAQFKHLVEQSLVGVYIVQDQKFVYVNPQMGRIHGYSTEEMLALNSVVSLVRPEDRDRVANNLARREYGEINSINYEFAITRGDGQIVFVEVFGSRTLFRGRPAIIGSAIDITERKRAAEELSRERNLLRILIDNIPDYVYVKDNESRHLINNKANVALIGARSEEETLGKSVMDYFPSEIARQYMADDRMVISTNSPVINREEEVITDKGEHRWLLTTKVPLFGKDNVPIGIVGISRDITERKEIEHVLRESEEKYRHLFADNPMNLWVAELSTKRIIDVNHAAISEYGYSREEFLQMQLTDLRLAEDRDKMDEYIPGGPNQVGPSRKIGTWRHRKKDGSILLADIAAHEILYENRKALLVLAVNVTEKVKAEQKILETSEQLRELSGHLQQVREEERLNMAREIHDELGQMLTVLKMDVSWLNRRLGTAEDSLREKVRHILDALDKTVRTVRRIATELRPSVLDDLGLVAAMEWQAEEFRSKSGIDVKLQVSGEINASPAISINLFRIFQESLTNIARHSNATSVIVKFQCHDSMLMLSVTDNGSGFEQSVISSKKTLGLLGMKERALMIGGKYDIASTAGKGTQVTLTVPVNDCEPTTAKKY